MCFLLYIGTRTEGPRIPWSEGHRGISTAEVGERDEAMREKFSLPHITYVGSDQGCGCGFRNVMFQNGGWPEEYMMEVKEGTQQNHEALITFIQHYFGSEPFVELYGCWDGDFAEPVAHSEEIALPQIAEPRFHFRDRAYYKVLVVS